MIKELNNLCLTYKRNNLDIEYIKQLYDKSKDLRSFYKFLAYEFLDWEDEFLVSCNNEEDFETAWFVKGKISPIKNLLKMHIDNGKGNKAAIVWRGKDYTERILTFRSLYADVSKFASALKKLNISRKDSVLIFMPNIPELIIAMLACVKLGLVHTVYHTSYSAESLAERLNDCKNSVIITADGYYSKTTVNLKDRVDQAINIAENKPKLCIVVKRLGQRVHMKPLRDLWYHDLISDEDYSRAFAIEETVYDANDIIFTLVTSTHLTVQKALKYRAGGFLLWAKFSHQLLFDPRDDDILWNTADIAWITGHTYKVYGPLLNCQTIFLYEDTIEVDNASDFYEFLDKYNINKFYTTPTILNRLMNADEKKGVYRRQNYLELIATGGGRRNEESTKWAFIKLLNKRHPIINIFTLTEAGGAIAAQIPGYSEITNIYTVGKPLPGIPLQIIDGKTGLPIESTATKGEIVFTSSFPSLTAGICGDAKLLRTVYIKSINKQKFFKTGDGAEYLENKDIILTGRMDDVLHVGGKRINILMIEQAIKKHNLIKDVAVVNVLDEKRGETLIAFCVLNKNIDESLYNDLFIEINELIIDEIGEVVLPDIYKITSIIPKTPNGEIQREILKEIAQQII
ncbi:acetyl-CoA synthetase [Deferribacter desulfuricans SSM1]|uniref:acetate--CoA ligase n=1 Tax=Deferribacter desulfuricans (strain DSM 14783 / JCM 11476 / NBRC 101012 / SSM1) TaxID=639282 RepID=D3PCK7_DEFDS|nr:AMP-binding protein [Deferribacter desulfuricans]BAI80330.1 acetyl-CoA synthetase [Deferribacter desulfuricans SSM1]